MKVDEETQQGDFSILEARGIGRRLPDGDGWLFGNVSLTIGAGERIALVGPTGSGKTLLLRSLALLDPLDSGEVLWNGRAVSRDKVPPFRSRILYLHQRPPLFAGTVEDNLRQPFSLRIHQGQSFDRSRILHWMNEVGRDEEFLAKPSRNLSGGERQLTALLRAVQLDPIVLLLDEPTAALDPQTGRAVEKLVQDWHAEDAKRRSYMWVSHQTDQIKQITDRTVVMNNGQLTEEG